MLQHCRGTQIDSATLTSHSDSYALRSNTTQHAYPTTAAAAAATLTTPLTLIRQCRGPSNKFSLPMRLRSHLDQPYIFLNFPATMKIKHCIKKISRLKYSNHLTY